MTFKNYIARQMLSEADLEEFREICKDWRNFSTHTGKMDKAETLKMLKYLMTERPNSKTLGQRAVQRFNTLNKARWEDLINGQAD